LEALGHLLKAIAFEPSISKAKGKGMRENNEGMIKLKSKMGTTEDKKQGFTKKIKKIFMQARFVIVRDCS
jgi:hypothetical protein